MLDDEKAYCNRHGEFYSGCSGCPVCELYKKLDNDDLDGLYVPPAKKFSRRPDVQERRIKDKGLY